MNREEESGEKWTLEEHKKSINYRTHADRCMIDWNATHKRFGDYNYKKRPNYKRLVVVVCEECGARSIMQLIHYRHVCFECLSYSQQAILIKWHTENNLPLYPKWFSEQLKDKVRKKFGNKCVLCGKPQSSLPRKLAVHHINGNKQCEDINNLVPLCSRCHWFVDDNRDKLLKNIDKYLRRHKNIE